MNYIQLAVLLPLIVSISMHGMIVNTLHLQPAGIKINGPFIDQTLKLYKVEGDLYRVSQKSCHQEHIYELCKLLDNTAKGFKNSNYLKDEKQKIDYFVRKNKYEDPVKLTCEMIKLIASKEDWTLERTQKVITDFLAIRCALALKKEGLIGKKDKSSLG